MRSHLDRDLDALKRDILTMGAMVEDATLKSIDCLLNRRPDLGEEVLEGDDAIDMKELEVEDKCLKALALHQPVAGDLRYIIAILKVNNDLERMGDLAGHIAARAIYLAQHPPIGMPRRFEEMVGIVRTMVRKCLDALVNKDSALALEVVKMDDQVDEIHWESYEELRERMRRECEIIDLAFHTISAVRHLERIADHAANIAEDVYFMVEGEVIRHKLDTGDLEDN
jgi:phosphate transport system protein